MAINGNSSPSNLILNKVTKILKILLEHKNGFLVTEMLDEFQSNKWGL